MQALGEDMTICIICCRDAGFFSEICDNCKEKRPSGGRRKPVSWAAVSRIAIISILGLFPSLLVSAGALVMTFIVPSYLVQGRYAIALFIPTVSCMSIFGTYSLTQYLFGRPLRDLRAGMLAGLAVMIIMVTHLFVRTYLASLGFEGMLPKENLALAVGAINSVIYTIPLIVYSRLVYLSWKPYPRTSTQ